MSLFLSTPPPPPPPPPPPVPLPIKHHPLQVKIRQQITSFSLSPCETNIVSSTHFLLQVHSTQNGDLVVTANTQHTKKITKVVYFPDSSGVVTADANMIVRVWTPMLKRVITLLGHTGALTDLAPHPSSNYFASSGIDNTVRIWERVVNKDAGKGKGEGEEGKWLRKCKTILSDHRPSPGSELHPQMHSFPHRGVACVLFSPDGLSLATGGTDGRVFLYTLNLYEKEGFVFFDTAKTKTLICGGGGSVAARCCRCRSTRRQKGS